MSLSFPVVRDADPRPEEAFAAIMADPGFGDHFSDHMAVALWTKTGGWSRDRIEPYGPFRMDPATAVLHYAQEIFEGMKAYRHADGSIWLFRPDANARRLNSSAARMMLPNLPETDFLAAVTALVRADQRWVPSGTGEQSLYLRPFMFASEVFLGVRAAQRVMFSVIASPAGPYFKGGVKPVDIWVTDTYARAGVGGTGAAKCGGNYAASLIAQYEGYEHGCSQVLFIEAADKDRVEELGGMAQAIEAGIPKLRIEEAAARTQARIDSGRQPLIGVNAYRPDVEDPLEVRVVDNAAVRSGQIEKLRRLRKERDDETTTAALDALTKAADTGEGNLLALSIDAARAMASLGEISDAIERSYGRHQAQIKTISGVYRSEMGENATQVMDVREQVERFAEADGRRPRILLAKMGQDGHDRGQKVIASAFADLGFDVDIGPLFQTPAEAASQAVEADVHIVGVSSLAAGHLTLVPELRDALAEAGRDDIMIVVGGVIPPQDFPALREAGAAAIFPPGTVIAEAAEGLLDQLLASVAQA